MMGIQRVKRLLRNLSRQRQKEDDLSKELQFHLQNEIKKNIASGRTPKDARYAALRNYGGIDQVKEECRDVRGTGLLDELWQDLRYGLRMLGKSPGFTITATLILALGIAANGVVFSFLHAMLLRPLPFKNPHRIAVVQEIDSQGQLRDVPSSTFLAWKDDELQAFEILAGYRGMDTILTGRDYSDQLMGARVTKDLFPLLGAVPALGRGFDDSDYELSSGSVAVISDSLWKRRFGATPEILDQTLTLDGEKYAIVGVMAPEFRFWSGGDSNDVLVPLRFDPQELTPNESRPLHVLGRLRVGKTFETAGKEISFRLQRLVHDYPELYKGWSARVLPLNEWHRQRQPVFLGMLRTLPLLLGAVGFVLLLACANLASLALARGLGRRKEMAIRSALGAGRWRLVRQLLVESILLSLLAGMLGLLLAFWGVRLCLLLLPEEIKWIVPGGKETIGVDLSVCGFTFLVSLLTAMLFGLVPAVKASKANLNEALKEGKRTVIDPSARGGEGGLLVVFEIAVSLVLLIGASLMVQSFLRLTRVEVGFNPDRVVTMLLLSQRDSPHDSAFYTQLIQRVKALPGVEAASLMDNVPAGEFWLSGDEFNIEGQPINKPLVPRAISAVIDPDFLKTMEIPLLRGRAFTDHDTKEFPGVALISQSLARRYFPGEDPIGKRLRPGEPEAKAPWLSVVGIVADVQHKLNSEPIPTLYSSYLQQGPIGGMYLFVRTMSPAANAVDAIRREVWRIDRNQPITYFWTMNHVVSASIFVNRFIAWLLGSYAALALSFSLMGIYGVVSYGVSRKAHEIGVRMALGAQRRDVLRLFLRRALFPALIGVGLGVMSALATTRLLRSQLHGISPTDAWTFLEISFLLVSVVLLAIYVPARRATRVDPVVALRCE